MTIRKHASQLTEEEQDIFTYTFYDQGNFDIDDGDSPTPWGCPWLHGSDPMLEGEDIEDMAIGYYEEVKDEIKTLLKDEQSTKDKVKE